MSLFSQQADQGRVDLLLGERMTLSKGKERTELLIWLSYLSEKKIFLTGVNTTNKNIKVNSDIGEVTVKSPKFQAQMKDIWGP